MTHAVAGASLVTLAGLLMGTSAWPIKVVRRFRFEHWSFASGLVGLIVLPWTITVAFCPDAGAAYRSVPVSTLLISNASSIGWGVANVLCGICFVRIGVSLTSAVLTGLGVSVGVSVPMLAKGSGQFSGAPGPASAAGMTVLAGVAVMLVGVVLACAAGREREGTAHAERDKPSGMTVGLAMAAVAGILSAGVSFSFVYSQGPIVAAMEARGAGDIPANFSVWAIGLLGGAITNISYPAYLMTRNRSWSLLMECPRDLALSLAISIHVCLAIALVGEGMLLFGALGASVGFGIQQATQMIGSQGVGFVSGEWRGVRRSPRVRMGLAIALLIAAAIIMACGNALA